MKKNKSKLPFGLKTSDLNYPKTYKASEAVLHYIDLYKVKGVGPCNTDGWVVATLGISGAGKRSTNNTARTYAVDENGKVWRVGNGPHVLQTITCYITKSRAPKLKKLIDLYNTGLADANVIRDKISTKRARTALRRRGFFW